ncbi:MAG: hypothetical protein GXO23_06170 [Crenarchaeota archaeon]|nr:hypothetical protein [Thermoproteota archaeon]
MVYMISNCLERPDRKYPHKSLKHRYIVKVQLIESSEISKMLRENGNHDYRIETGEDELYVRIGVDRLWVTSKKMNNKVIVLRTCLRNVAYANLPAIVRRILVEFEDKGETSLDILPHLLT